MAAKKSSKQPDSFEDKLSALEQLIDRLEQGDLPLDQALREFEQGVQLARQCQTELQAAEQKVQILLQKQADASPQDYLPADDSAADESDADD